MSTMRNYSHTRVISSPCQCFLQLPQCCCRSLGSPSDWSSSSCPFIIIERTFCSRYHHRGALFPPLVHDGLHFVLGGKVLEISFTALSWSVSLDNEILHMLCKLFMDYGFIKRLSRKITPKQPVIIQGLAESPHRCATYYYSRRMLPG